MREPAFHTSFFFFFFSIKAGYLDKEISSSVNYTSSKIVSI